MSISRPKLSVPRMWTAEGDRAVRAAHFVGVHIGEVGGTKAGDKKDQDNHHAQQRQFVAA
ncbi:MAG: hypothetical protein R2932_10305 [Caldilineaceae bacterium]